MDASSGSGQLCSVIANWPAPTVEGRRPASTQSVAVRPSTSGPLLQPLLPPAIAEAPGPDQDPTARGASPEWSSSAYPVANLRASYPVPGYRTENSLSLDSSSPFFEAGTPGRHGGGGRRLGTGLGMGVAATLIQGMQVLSNRAALASGPSVPSLGSVDGLPLGGVPTGASQDGRAPMGSGASAGTAGGRRLLTKLS